MSRLHSEAAQQLAELAARVAEGQRLSRGRRYQRQGNVLDLDVSPGLVTASVAGSRAEPYEVSIACKHANENERRAAADSPASAVPRVVDVAFTCICPDWGDPCKHGVAVMLAFAEEVDGDASLLFEWRSIDDLVAPLPAGTESLEIHAPRTEHTGDHRDEVRPVPDLRMELADTLRDASELRDGPQAGDDGVVAPPSVLDAFFSGTMPATMDDLVGPIEDAQLDTYRQVRVGVEDFNAASVFADALDAIADYWLTR